MVFGLWEEGVESTSTDGAALNFDPFMTVCVRNTRFLIWTFVLSALAVWAAQHHGQHSEALMLLCQLG